MEELIREGRMQGNTTRLINYYIEQLYTFKPITIVDHTLDGTNRNCNNELLHKIEKRLMYEDWGFKRIFKLECINYKDNLYKFVKMSNPYNCTI